MNNARFLQITKTAQKKRCCIIRGAGGPADVKVRKGLWHLHLKNPDPDLKINELLESLRGMKKSPMKNAPWSGRTIGNECVCQHCRKPKFRTIQGISPFLALYATAAAIRRTHMFAGAAWVVIHVSSVIAPNMASVAVRLSKNKNKIPVSSLLRLSQKFARTHRLKPFTTCVLGAFFLNVQKII